MIAWRRLLVAVSMAFLVLPAAVAKQDRLVATPGGNLVIMQMDRDFLGKEFAIMLGKREVMRTKEGDENTPFNDFPVPRLLKYVGKAIPPFDAVAVFQQFNWGNACNGGPIWFLGIYKDGAFTVSDRIDFCGGLSPMISVSSNAIHVVFPISQTQEGAEDFRYEEWIYFQGIVRSAKIRGRK